MTIRTCDICGKRLGGEDNVVRLQMGRPVLLDAYGEVAVPSEYELCSHCGFLLEEKLIDMRRETTEGGKPNGQKQA